MSADKAEPRPSRHRIELTGRVVEALPSSVFRVELGNGRQLLAYLYRNMEESHICTLLGDKVLVEIVH